jgi:2-hydroxychromene-2-carboxylate isomerase
VIDITLFTDPACPFAFSAEPARLRLRWHYGDGLRWRLTMIVLTLEPGEADKLAGGAPGLQARYGMPIHPFPSVRPASSEPACRAVVAARGHAPAREGRLLRALRVRTMSGGLLDDPQLIAASARDAGLDPEQLAAWSREPATDEALSQDIADSRRPSAAARALDHKLGGPADQRRYTAPSYELRNGSATASLPGFHPVEAYEAVIANLDPALPRRPSPETVSELLEWADAPLATAEIVQIMQRPQAEVRAQLATSAHATPAGADMYWALAGRP